MMIHVGVIGIGNMGSTHCKRLVEGEVENAVLSAVCDIRIDRLDAVKEKLNIKNVLQFTCVEEMFSSGKVEAVIIATPHYLHPDLAIRALNHNLHVLVEKPIGVYTEQARKLVETAMDSQCICGIMLNQRTNPYYKKARELVFDGVIGEIRRFSWIITDWFRTQSYYDSAEWRATWYGEGGGVLINQCPHSLDLLTWICGMPRKVHAFCKNGKYHSIETEDEVTAYMEYDNGTTGVLVASTGEAPGTNRIEICGSKGKIVLEGPESLELYSAEMDFVSYIQHEFGPWNKPLCKKEIITVKTEKGQPRGGQHLEILKNWILAITGDKSKFVDVQEGMNSLILANAMYMSSWLQKTIEIPFDENRYHEMLLEKIRYSSHKKRSSRKGY